MTKCERKPLASDMGSREPRSGTMKASTWSAAPPPGLRGLPVSRLPENPRVSCYAAVPEAGLPDRVGRLKPVQPRPTAGTVKAVHETVEARLESPGFIRGEEVKTPLWSYPRPDRSGRRRHANWPGVAPAEACEPPRRSVCAAPPASVVPPAEPGDGTTRSGYLRAPSLSLPTFPVMCCAPPWHSVGATVNSEPQVPRSSSTSGRAATSGGRVSSLVQSPLLSASIRSGAHEIGWATLTEPWDPISGGHETWTG